MKDNFKTSLESHRKKLKNEIDNVTQPFKKSYFEDSSLLTSQNNLLSARVNGEYDKLLDRKVDI